jgi:hypothetical protein
MALTANPVIMVMCMKFFDQQTDTPSKDKQALTTCRNIWLQATGIRSFDGKSS